MTRRDNIQSQDAAAAAAQWLAEFDAALQRQDAPAAADLFVPAGHWRDIVAFLCAVMFTVVWWFAADHGRPHYWAIFVALIVVSLLAAWYAGRGIWQAARSLIRAGRKDADKETG